MLEWLLLAAAGLFAGMLNAVAGGGSFITLPVLIWIGVPPVTANATGTAALLPGYLASAWRFRHDLHPPRALTLSALTATALIGGATGATALLLTNERLFATLIPGLILFSTAMFMIAPHLSRRRGISPHTALPVRRADKIRTLLVLLTVTIYGGYFNGGLGIILLAALALLGERDLIAMNAIKNLISALLTVVAVLIYGMGQAVNLHYLPILAVAAIVGGHAGAALAYRAKQSHLRAIAITTGLVMAILFLWQQV